jgi:sugar (pentulose or hexulose) kinase
VRTAAAQMAGPRRDHVLPDPERQALYADAHKRYRRLYAALRPLFG